MQTIGKYTYFAGRKNILCDNCGNLIIGKFCSIADNITIYLGGDHRPAHVSTYPFGNIHQGIFNNYNIPPQAFTLPDVVVGNDVWIGSDVTLMYGANIGDGAVIGNGSVVRGKIKPYSVVLGNPAQFCYFRFDKEVIQKLLKLKWWDLDDKIINELVPHLITNRGYEALFSKCDELKLNYK